LTRLKSGTDAVFDDDIDPVFAALKQGRVSSAARRAAGRRLMRRNSRVTRRDVAVTRKSRPYATRGRV